MYDNTYPFPNGLNYPIPSAPLYDESEETVKTQHLQPVFIERKDFEIINRIQNENYKSVERKKNDISITQFIMQAKAKLFNLYERLTNAESGYLSSKVLIYGASVLSLVCLAKLFNFSSTPNKRIANYIMIAEGNSLICVNGNLNLKNATLIARDGSSIIFR